MQKLRSPAQLDSEYLQFSVVADMYVERSIIISSFKVLNERSAIVLWQMHCLCVFTVAPRKTVLNVGCRVPGPLKSGMENVGKA